MYSKMTDYLKSYREDLTLEEQKQSDNIHAMNRELYSKGVSGVERLIDRPFGSLLEKKENFSPKRENFDSKRENFDSKRENFDSKRENFENSSSENLEGYTLEYDTGNVDTFNPKIWGPSYWFTLHISAAYYPITASSIVKERMKNRILAIPYEIPCAKCRSHAIAFIEQHLPNLDIIVGGRHTLGRFYVDFHNQVNKRHNKREWSYEEAYKMYSSGANITYLSGVKNE